MCVLCVGSRRRCDLFVRGAVGDALDAALEAVEGVRSTLCVTIQTH